MDNSSKKNIARSAIGRLLPPKIYVRWKLFQHHSEFDKYMPYLKQNEKFRNVHKGERCFIIGNGPSLQKVDFSSLEDEIVFTVNQLPRNPRYSDFKANYHFWADALFFDLHDDRPEDMELLDVMKGVNKNNPDVRVFYDLRAFEMVQQYRLCEQLNISYFGILPCRPDKFEKSKIDFTSVVPNYPTVIFYVILMAVYMGFSEIYLLGCDCTGLVSIINSKIKNAEEAVYGYKISENEKKRMERVAKERTLEDEVSSYLELLRGYRRMYQYCERNGTKLFNATEGGALESLPKVRLADVLRKR